MILFQLFAASLLIIQGHSKSINKKISEAYKIGNGGLDFLYRKNPSVYRVELDILLKENDYIRRQSELLNEGTGREKRKAVMPTGLRWTDKEIPYTFQILTFSIAERGRITDAIDQWNNYTCLNFRPATASDENKIRIQTGNGCASYVGMIGGTQEVILGRGCRYKDIAVHEFGHAAGFYHEQSRLDRDNYVDIVYRNIPLSVLPNFQKARSSEITNLDVPYDYRSVMHYDGTAFGRLGRTTIRTKDPAYQDIIGTAPGLSFSDIKLANLMYDCDEGCSDSTSCPDEGFKGKDCVCYCPKDDPEAPIQVCDGTTMTPPICEDRLLRCPLLALRCITRPIYMRMNCPRTCNVCLEENAYSLPCEDTVKNCDSMKEQGHCEMDEFMEDMATNCPRTCGFCDN